MSAEQGLGVLIAAPLPTELVRPLEELGPAVRVLHDPSVLPPARWPGDIRGEPGFRRDAAAEARWTALLGQADVLFGVPGGSARGLVEALRLAPRVRWVQARNAGAGQELKEARALAPELLRDVVVTSASGVHAAALAEFALLGIFACIKRLDALERDKAARRWPKAKPTVELVAGRTVLVVGLGAIGMEVARLAGAVGMHVLGVRRTPGAVPGIDAVGTPDRLRELAAEADALVVTLPLTEESRGLVDAAVLAALRPGAVVVNVGRGAVLDEGALIRELRSGRLAGACLDVFATEPLPPDSPLWELDNVIISPHGAARTEDETARIVELFADNLRRRLAGKPLRNVVDPEKSY